MTWLMILIAVVVFFFTASVVVLLGVLSARRSVSMQARMRELFPASEIDRLRPDELGDGNRDSMPTISRLLSGRRIADQLYTELSAAGLTIRPSEFVGILAASVILFQVLAVLFAKSLLGIIAFALIGVLMPIFVLRNLQNKRRAAFNSQIADALTMMASSLRSGFSFLRAMQIVAQEMPDPISQEFNRIINEVNVGKHMDDALRSSVNRMKSYDFDLAVTAVVIQHQVGGNLAEILDTIAATIRERVRIIGEIRALTAEGKISGVILVLMPIVLALVIILFNPGFLSVLVEYKIGHILIGAAIILQIVGGFWINKMLSMDI